MAVLNQEWNVVDKRQNKRYTFTMQRYCCIPVRVTSLRTLNGMVGQLATSKFNHSERTDDLDHEFRPIVGTRRDVFDLAKG